MEAALSIYLENFATTLGSREQLAIAEVADALLVIPKALAVNAAKDATELVCCLAASPDLHAFMGLLATAESLAISWLGQSGSQML